VVGLRQRWRFSMMAPAFDEADEDTRRVVRKRAEVIAEHVSIAKRIGAIVAPLGTRELASWQARSGHADDATKTLKEMVETSLDLAEDLAHANSESSLGHRVEQIQPLQGHAPSSALRGQC
jgi:hypothetical protein